MVTFRPEAVIDYLFDIYPVYHAPDLGEVSEAEIAVITRHEDELVVPAHEFVPAPRQRVVRTISALLRDYSFRIRVKRSYGNGCAVCGVQLGLPEAGHIIPLAQPHSTNETRNGIALCPSHHRAYDMGLLGVDRDYRIVVNEAQIEAIRQGGLDSGLEDFLNGARVGERIHLPQNEADWPDPDYLEEGLRIRGFRPWF